MRPVWRTNSRALLGSQAAAVIIVGWATLAVSMLLGHTEDVDYYKRSAALVLHGSLPYRDFAFVYPPLAIVAYLIPYAFSFGHGQPLWVYGGLFVLENAAGTTALGVLIARCARTGKFPCPPGQALRDYAVLILLAATVLPLRYDLFPTLLTGLAFWLVIRERPGLAGFCLGLGIAAKLYPVVLWPVLALYYWAGGRLEALRRLTLGCLGALALALAPFAGVRGPAFSSSLTYHLQRGLEIESVAAGVLLLCDRLGLTTTGWAYNYGAIHLACPWAAGWLKALPIVFACGFGILLVCCGRQFREEQRTGGISPQSLAAFLSAALLVFILANKVFSPQYIFWLLPFLPLVRPALRTLGVTVFALTFLIFPVTWGLLLQKNFGVILLLNLRNAVALVLAMRLIWPQTQPGAQGSPMREEQGAAMADLEDSCRHGIHRRILVIYDLAGGGHYSHAKAIRDRFATRFPGCTVTLMHASAEARSRAVTLSYSFYNRMLTLSPRLVRVAHWFVNTIEFERYCVRSPFFPQAKRNLTAYFREAKPDVIVSVFSGFNYPALHFREKLGWARDVPYIAFVTDLTHGFVRTWAEPGMDLMIGMLPETREQLIAYGMPDRKIRVLNGMPVPPAFHGPRLTKAEARGRLGVRDRLFTVLLTFGGMATGGTLRFARQIAESGLPVQLLVACGRNDALRRRMDRLALRAAIPIRVFGFTDRMPLLMDAADAAIGKPGPATIAELACREVPLLLDGTVRPMPQEQGNLEFVVREGLGWVITRSRPAASLIQELMEHPERADALRANMRRFQQEEILDTLVDIIAGARVDGGERRARPDTPLPSARRRPRARGAGRE